MPRTMTLRIIADIDGNCSVLSYWRYEGTLEGLNTQLLNIGMTTLPVEQLGGTQITNWSIRKEDD